MRTIKQQGGREKFKMQGFLLLLASTKVGITHTLHFLPEPSLGEREIGAANRCGGEVKEEEPALKDFLEIAEE